MIYTHNKTRVKAYEAEVREAYKVNTRTENTQRRARMFQFMFMCSLLCLLNIHTPILSKIK